MTALREICEYLGQFAPVDLAEDWDNVGLLAGDLDQEIRRIMTCLTVTPTSADEAIHQRADLIVTHHPMPFRPLARLTAETTPGRLLWRLANAGVAIYSPHTAFDSAARGINQRLAEALHLEDIRVLVPAADDESGTRGSGRVGRLPAREPLSAIAERLKSFLRIDGLHAVGPLDQPIQTVAVACGAAGSFLTQAVAAGCDLLVLGETTFHTCLEAEANGLSLLLPGHFASERFAVEALCEVLQAEFSGLEIWASREERDPLQWF